MILTAHQPTYLPWLGLFDKIARADTYVSFNTVQYMPKEWQNRNRIKTPTGPIWLTVPVLRKGYRGKPLHQIEINNDEPWRRRHWNTIEHNYRYAPYFSRNLTWLKPYYDTRGDYWRGLAHLTETMLQTMLAILGIETPILYASDFDFKGSKSGLVLDMCKQLGATSYIFGGEGRNYADVAAFEAAGVEPIFQRYVHPTYPQLYGEFVSHLSVIDLLMNCGPDSLSILRNDNGPPKRAAVGLFPTTTDAVTPRPQD